MKLWKKIEILKAIKQKIILYKIVISILFGLIGFFLNFQTIIFPFGDYTATILLGLFFPLIITLSWGWRYGLLSALAGGCQSMWWLWGPSNGYAIFLVVPPFTLWIVWHGFFMELRKKQLGDKWWLNPYVIEIPFRLLSTINLLFISKWAILSNPPPWDWGANASTTISMEFSVFVALKQALIAFILLLIVDVLLHLSPIRKFFILNKAQNAQKTGYIISASLLLGCLYWIIDTLFHVFVFHKERLFIELFAQKIPPQNLFNRFVVFIFCLIFGLVAARLLRKQKEDEAALKKLAEQLHQSQKLKAIGQLAGGIAHDFNNSLMGIIGSVEIIRNPNIDQIKHEKFLDIITSAANRAKELTQKLLLFSRKGEKITTSVDMMTITTETVDLLKHTIDKNISISILNHTSLSMIIGDESLLQNAIMNIAINASHAMPDGGKLIFILKNITFNSDDCKRSPFEIKPGKYLDIAISDTGCGMTSDVQSHIFEPFFSTKKQGEGTGLGLATVYGTILDHGGAIALSSEVGTGTTFHLYFPVTKTVSNPTPPEAIISGTGTILIIDDEESIRLTTSIQLESLGYSTICAENGAAGLLMFTQNKKIINLVILDMIMPIMGGREAFFKLREINPKIPIIISSGFTKESDMEILKSQGISGILQKPFHKSELAKVVAHNILKV